MKPFLERFQLSIDWTDLSGYARRLESSRSAINLGTIVGAAQVRIAVLGLGDAQPSPTQLAQMEKLVETAMKQGARGLSSALIYPPGSYAKTPELIALAQRARGRRCWSECCARDRGRTFPSAGRASGPMDGAVHAAASHQA